MITQMIINNSKIIEKWDKLSKTDAIGLVKLLYSSYFPHYIYCTKFNPEGNVGIGISYSDTVKINITSLSRLQDVHVYITKDSSYSNKNLLILQLSNIRFIEIFSVLCENLIMSIADLTNSDEAIHTIVSQLEKWKKLFNNLDNEGLSLPEQQGLYGELYFLRKILNFHKYPSDVLRVWVGVDNELRDFQSRECAIEVKTTSSGNHQRLTINSERQLDNSLLEDLFLYHLSVETSKQNGETLNQIVDCIKEYLDSDFIALNIFIAKLLTVGYHDHHRDLYSNKSYRLRRENCYRISGNFPRIKESELMKGVGDVQYTIITDMCDEYLVPEIVIFKTLELCKK